jgi:hypothetical protein
MSKNKKKRQIIKTLTLKHKMKHHYTKWNNGIFVADKENSDSLSPFSANKFLPFSISRMSVEENFVEKLQRQSKKRLQKLKQEKQEKQR